MYSALKQVGCSVQQFLLINIRHNYLPAIGKTSSSYYTSPENFTEEPNFEKKKKMIELEMQMLRDEGEFFVPDKVPNKHWNDLLSFELRAQRLKYYKYLKKIEIESEKKAKKKTETAIKYQQRNDARDSSDHIKYGLRRNSMFIHIRNPAMNRFYNLNMRHSILFGEKLVLDFGFHENMNRQELTSCVKQVAELYGFNKINKDPFELYFCNLAPNSDLDKKLSKAIGTLKTSKCMINATEKSYLDFFPKEKLVYLTPDCNNDLQNFNHDDIYVIGGFVDRGPSVPVSLAKAKREGLRVARLPLERYTQWGHGRKALTLDQVVKILLTVKNTKSWEKAFEHLPSRKIFSSRRF